MYPLYYMRDNHTFRRLPDDLEGALAGIQEELDAGYKHGVLFTDRFNSLPLNQRPKEVCAPSDYNVFWDRARAYIELAIKFEDYVEAEYASWLNLMRTN